MIGFNNFLLLLLDVYMSIVDIIVPRLHAQCTIVVERSVQISLLEYTSILTRIQDAQSKKFIFALKRIIFFMLPYPINYFKMKKKNGFIF